MTAWTTVLAAAEEQAPEAETTEIPGAREVRSFTEMVADQIDNDLWRAAVEGLLGPALQVAFILLLAVVVLLLLRRGIDGVVARAKDPDAPRGRRLRRRVGLPDRSGQTTSLRRVQRADALGALLRSIVTVVVWVLATFLILAEFGVNLAPLVAGAGVIGLALGFGAQDLVKDFLSGVFMLAEDQYGVGDVIDAGEAMGVVEGVTLRTTRIRDVEGTLWHVPNGEIRRIGNSSQQWARSLLDIGVSYRTDVDVAIDLIERVAEAMAEEDGYRDEFLDAPEVWGVQTLGADSIDIRLVIKTEAGKQWGISRELRRRIKAAFDTAGIEIPFPQRTVWLRPDDDHASPRPDAATIERAVATAGAGDRGPEKATHQDEAAVAGDVEEEVIEAAAPSDDEPR